MSKGRSGSMLGVGGTRSNLSRSALHGGRAAGRPARGGPDPATVRRELLRKLQERRNPQVKTGERED